MPLQLTSTAFNNGDMIPRKYSCDGEDISPPLQWSNPPKGTQSYALICDDPDAPVGTWDHWIIFNIQGTTSALSRAIPPESYLPDGSTHGENGWGRLGYGGPCPPSGTHRYFFRLYALDTMLDLQAGASKTRLLKAMERHILAQAELMGKYKR